VVVVGLTIIIQMAALIREMVAVMVARVSGMAGLITITVAEAVLADMLALVAPVD
jgi:hypothetical protein